MKARIFKSEKIVEVSQDPEDITHFYQFGEHGRLVSDYDISDLELIEDDEPENLTYENLWVVRNESGRLLMFTEKPKRLNNIKKWDASVDPIILSTTYPGIDLRLFDNLTWNDDPVKIRMILVKI